MGLQTPSAPRFLLLRYVVRANEEVFSAKQRSDGDGRAWLRHFLPLCANVVHGASLIEKQFRFRIQASCRVASGIEFDGINDWI